MPKYSSHDAADDEDEYFSRVLHDEEANVQDSASREKKFISFIPSSINMK
jgi:hypothetical protein